MISASVNSVVPLQIIAADGNTALFGQARVYGGGILITTINLAHVTEGLYSGDWIPDTEGYFTYVSELYTDSGHTIPARFDKGGDLIDVNSIKNALSRILGLHHENAVIDNETYNSDGNLLTARLRTYDSKANALAAGVTGLLFTYSIAASYTSGRVSNYTMVRE